MLILPFIVLIVFLVGCELPDSFAGEAFRFDQKEVDFDKKGREYLDRERDQSAQEAEARNDANRGRSVEYGAQERMGDGEQRPQEGQNAPGERDVQQQNIDGRRESGTTDTTCSGLKKRLGLCSEEATPQNGLDEPENNGCTAEQAARGDCSINTGDVFGQDDAPGEDGGCTESQRRLGLCGEDEIEKVVREDGSTEETTETVKQDGNCYSCTNRIVSIGKCEEKCSLTKTGRVCETVCSEPETETVCKQITCTTPELIMIK